MPGDDTTPNEVTDNPIYKAILEKLEAQDAKLDAMGKKVDDVTGFNKELLSRSPGATVTDADVAKKKLESYINEN